MKTTILVTHDMGAVKKDSNKAVLIENGLVKALGSPENVANQYSFDNTAPLQQGGETSGIAKSNQKKKSGLKTFSFRYEVRTSYVHKIPFSSRLILMFVKIFNPTLLCL